MCNAVETVFGTAKERQLRRKVADLQRQLQQAQEERGIEQQGRQGAERQRDVAIERGRLMWREYLAQVAFGRVLAVVREKRAERAEALVEKGQQLREELEEVGNHAAGIVWDDTLLAEWDALKAPAEALAQRGEGDA